MAHPLQSFRLGASLHILRHRPPGHIHQHVCRFSTTPFLRFPSTPRFEPPTSKNPAQRSPTGTMKDINAADLPEELGLLDGTFIWPVGPTLPSFFSSPRGRLALHWQQIKFHFSNILGLYAYRFAPPKHQRPRLRLRQVSTAAATLHKNVYAAFADNDKTSFRPLTTITLYNIFCSRLASRPQGQVCEWTLHSYTKPLRKVSDRAARLPIEGVFIRQAVVRVWTTQSMKRWDAKGKLIPGTDGVRDVKEWVVLQKRLIVGKESPWVIWGILGPDQINSDGSVKQR